MAESKTPISKASSYAEIGEFWDQHDLADHWNQTHEAGLEVDLRTPAVYVAIERSLAEGLRSAAETHAVSRTLLNLWVREHIASEATRK